MSKHECVGELFGRIDEFDSALNMALCELMKADDMSTVFRLEIGKVLKYFKRINRELGGDIYKNNFISIGIVDYDHIEELANKYENSTPDGFVDFYSPVTVMINECRVRARAFERTFLN